MIKKFITFRVEVGKQFLGEYLEEEAQRVKAVLFDQLAAVVEHVDVVLSVEWKEGKE